MNPYLLFCPYLPLDKLITFDDWELGPLQSFEDRWADSQFKDQATTFLSKFVGPDNRPITNPALLCRKGKQLDGQQPSPEKVRALELSLAFACIDQNPRHRSDNRHQQAQKIVTADNAELHVWPIDLEKGYVTTETGCLVQMINVGYWIRDDKLVLRPPLDLPPLRSCSPDPLLLTGIYETVLASHRCPDKSSDAHRVRIALEWFVKAWRNTATLHYPERLVFLKTAFEALTGTSNSSESGCWLRHLFEELPTTTARNSEILVWSPKEEPISRTWTDKRGQSRNKCMTDLEVWFMEFGNVRNSIIHEGARSEFIYPGSNPVYQPITSTAYNGYFFFTAEFLLRAVIRVLLSTKLGYGDAWRKDAHSSVSNAQSAEGGGGDAMQIQWVKHVNDPVQCPECGAVMFKINKPIRPWPSSVRNAQIMDKYLGLTCCENPDCEYGETKEPISWAVETPQ